MKASETNLLQFLKNPKHLIIPVYQRTYSWTKPQCEQLWKDIARASKNEEEQAHFLGSIVYIEKGLYHVSSIPQVLIIDGQQRITTISLLLAAFADVIDNEIKECTMTNSRKIRNYYLFNAEEDDETYYKLALTKKDIQTYNNIIEQKSLDEKYVGHLVDNYEYFYEKIKNSDLTLDEIYKGLQTIIVVDISLDREKDNPQLIFESLNSTGLDLSQADLIRNYFLMGLEPVDQNRIYNDYWLKLEEKFDQLKGNYFDRFIRDYLTVKTGIIPNIGSVYEEFKKYVYEEKHDIEDVIKDVFKYGNYYFKLANEEPKLELEAAFKDLRELRVDVSYPFLLQLYDDYESNIISEKEFISVITFVESYVVRRAICGIPTNSLNKTFASLNKTIDKNNYLSSVKELFRSMTSYRRFPANNEFSNELGIKDIYNLRIRNYLLRKLENYQRKERIHVSNYTIEHIMPQNRNLSLNWKNTLGKDWETTHAKYLHRLGNLTLTGYNSELSDRSFQEKSEMEGGFKNSPLWLNRSVAKHKIWTPEQIEERTEEVIQRALKIWDYPHQ